MLIVDNVLAVVAKDLDAHLADSRGLDAEVLNTRQALGYLAKRLTGKVVARPQRRIQRVDFLEVPDRPVPDCLTTVTLVQ